MFVSEFIERTGYRPTAEEYAEIEKAYYVFKGDKDAYCRAWSKANPHKAGTLWAAIKEQERLSKVFDKVAEFVRKCKRKREEFYYMSSAEQQAFMDDMQEKCKCKDRRELRHMIEHLTEAHAVWRCWRLCQRGQDKNSITLKQDKIMKKSLANQICKLWNEQHVGSYEPTKTQAIVCESPTKGDYSVEVHPIGEENNGHSFHHIEVLATIEGAFNVSAYITQDENYRLYARIF